MAATYTSIFEHDLNNALYTKLETTDKDVALVYGNIHSLVLSEALDMGSPVLKTRFMDSLGNLTSISYYSPDALYNFYFGETKAAALKSEFSLAINKSTAFGVGTLENTSNEITFLNSKWLNTLSTPVSRSWNQVKHSDVVNQLATEAGSATTYIEETDLPHNVIQPAWTNFHLMRWLSNHSVSKDGLAGYQFAVRNDGNLLFASFNHLFQQPSKLTLHLTETSPADKSMYGFHLLQNYASMVKQGALGYTYNWYDYANREFNQGNRLITDTAQPQLSDWWYAAKSHVQPAKWLDAARDSEAIQQAEAKMMNMAHSIQEAETSVNGTPNLHVGDIVNLVIKPAQRLEAKHYVEQYSGNWMIAKISHVVDFVEKHVRTDLKLIRAGVNANTQKSTALVKTTAGKIAGAAASLTPVVVMPTTIPNAPQVVADQVQQQAAKAPPPTSF